MCHTSLTQLIDKKHSSIRQKIWQEVVLETWRRGHIACIMHVWYAFPIFCMRTFFPGLYTKLFVRDAFFLFGTLCALIAHIALWALFVLRFDILYQPGRDFIALHYRVFYGVDFLGEWYMLFIIPLFALLVLVVNYGFAKKTIISSPVIAASLSLVSCAVQVISFFALYFIIQINLF